MTFAKLSNRSLQQQSSGVPNRWLVPDITPSPRPLVAQVQAAVVLESAQPSAVRIAQGDGDYVISLRVLGSVRMDDPFEVDYSFLDE